jgi:hypothetical protein
VISPPPPGFFLIASTPLVSTGARGRGAWDSKTLLFYKFIFKTQKSISVFRIKHSLLQPKPSSRSVPLPRCSRLLLVHVVRSSNWCDSIDFYLLCYRPDIGLWLPSPLSAASFAIAIPSILLSLSSPCQK